jgi:hypothetical protein
MSFEERYPHTSKGLLDVLKSLLEFNPYFRPSPEEILKCPIFDKVRVSELEEASNAPFKIKDNFDFGQYFNYDTEELKNISKPELKLKLMNALIIEVKKAQKLKNSKTNDCSVAKKPVTSKNANK